MIKSVVEETKGEWIVLRITKGQYKLRWNI